MKNFASGGGLTVAVSAAAMSVVWALFVPYGYPWPSLAWAVVACGVTHTIEQGDFEGWLKNRLLGGP